MKKLLIVLLISTVYSTAFAGGSSKSALRISRAGIDSSRFYKDTIIKWMTLEEAMAAQQKKPKKIFISIFATWCGWCRKEDAVTYKNREIAHYMNQHFYPVKFNAETKTAVVFKGKTYEFNPDKKIFANAFATNLLNGKMSYPASVVLDETGEKIDIHQGYLDPISMEIALNFTGSNAYKKMKQGQFEEEFYGKIE